MTSWPEERARLLAGIPMRHLPNPGPDPLGEPIGPEDDEDGVTDLSADDPLTGCCTESQPCLDHFDDIFEAHRTGQEDRYLEHGAGQFGGAA